MPLRVHCPNGCLIRMPANRAGRIVRCPECKSAIRIPKVPQSESESGKPIPCQAKMAQPRNSGAVENANAFVPDESSPKLIAFPNDPHDSDDSHDPLPATTEKETTPESNESGDAAGSQRKSRLALPELISPLARNKPPRPRPSGVPSPGSADQGPDANSTADSTENLIENVQNNSSLARESHVDRDAVIADLDLTIHSASAPRSEVADRETIKQMEAIKAEQVRARAAKAEAERLRTERAQAAEEKATQLEADRVAAELAEAQRLKAEAKQKAIDIAEAERIELERLEAEYAEAERLEAERLESERLESERIEAERIEAARLETERVKAERFQAEKIAAEQLETQRLETQRLTAERLETERRESERRESERLESERIESERLETERIEANRVEAERAEAQRQQQEQIAERDAEQIAERDAERIAERDAERIDVEVNLSNGDVAHPEFRPTTESQLPVPKIRTTKRRASTDTERASEREFVLPLSLTDSISESLAQSPTLSTPFIELAPRKAVALPVPEEKNWQQRLQNANSDRRVLTLFFALCLCLVAIVNMVPALYHWYHWTQLTESMPLPRWIYIQIFVAAIHLVYAVFLAQIPDWSAMRSVSLAMLVVAFVFGIVSTGLLVGGGQGNLTSFLGIPYTLSRQASIWCVAMLCLATLMSYWGGKESSSWQRAEHLLKEILTKPTSQA